MVKSIEGNMRVTNFRWAIIIAAFNKYLFNCINNKNTRI